jgi:hypothetical protein
MCQVKVGAGLAFLTTQSTSVFMPATQQKKLYVFNVGKKFPVYNVSKEVSSLQSGKRSLMPTVWQRKFHDWIVAKQVSCLLRNKKGSCL